MISVTEQSTGLVYRTSDKNNNTLVPNFAYRAAVAYVTGAHSFKVGFNRTHGFQDTRTYTLNPFAYRFNQRRAQSVHAARRPGLFRNHLDNDIGIYAQDRWTSNASSVPGAAVRHFQPASRSRW